MGSDASGAQPQEVPAAVPENPQGATKGKHVRILALCFIAVFCASVIVVLALRNAGVFISLTQSARKEQEEEVILYPTLQEALEKDVTLSVASLVAQADHAFAAGEMIDARDLYEQAIAVGGDTAILRKLFDVALILGDSNRAESIIGLLSFHGLQDDVLDALRGFLALRKGDRETAKRLFSLRPHTPEYAYGLLIIGILEGDSEAQKYLDIIRQSADPFLVNAARVITGSYDEFSLFQDGQESHLRTLLSRSLAQVNRCPEAIVLLGEVVATQPDYRDAWIVLGYCRLMQGEQDAALAAFERAYSLDPQKAETQYFLGLTYDRLGDTRQAKMFLSFALQNSFEEGVVRQRIAALCEKEGDTECALEHYRALLHLEGESLEQREEFFLRAYWLALRVLRRPEVAEELALSAREEFGDTPFTLSLLGSAALALGNVDQAATLLSSAVEQDPSLAFAWLEKGALEETRNNMNEALAAYREAYNLSLGWDPHIVEDAANRHNALAQRIGAGHP